MTRIWISVFIGIVLGTAFTISARSGCIERRAGYCPPDPSVVITGPYVAPAAAGI